MAQHKQKGQVSLTALAVIITALLAVLGGTLLINLSIPPSLANAKQLVENSGQYVVFTTAQYDAIMAKINPLPASPANEATAVTAVVNAEAAAITSGQTLTTLLLHNENVSYLFPTSVTANVTLTAGNPLDNFSAWTEIVDSTATTLSSKFATHDGYLTEVTFRNYSKADEIYIAEFATDNVGTNVIGRVKVRSDWTYVLNISSERITAGQSIYYRMKAQTAGATLLADFRYYWRQNMPKSIEEVDLQIRATASMQFDKAASILRRYSDEIILNVIDLAAHRYDGSHLNREQEERKYATRKAARITRRRLYS